MEETTFMFVVKDGVSTEFLSILKPGPFKAVYPPNYYTWIVDSSKEKECRETLDELVEQKIIQNYGKDTPIRNANSCWNFKV
jgi:hypothetical protein